MWRCKGCTAYAQMLAQQQHLLEAAMRVIAELKGSTAMTPVPPSSPEPLSSVTQQFLADILGEETHGADVVDGGH